MGSACPAVELPYEVQMYLILPMFYFWGKRFRHPVVLGASGLLVDVADWLVSKRLGTPMLFPYAPFFTLGIALYFTKAKQMFSGTAYCVFLGLTVAAISVCHNSLADNYWIVLLFGLGFRWLREIESRWLCAAAHFVAKYSYGIYLSHIPIMWLVTEPMSAAPVVLRIAVFLILAPAVPILLYYTVEKPAIDLGTRLTCRLRYQPAANRMATGESLQ